MIRCHPTHVRGPTVSYRLPRSPPSQTHRRPQTPGVGDTRPQGLSLKGGKPLTSFVGCRCPGVGLGPWRASVRDRTPGESVPKVSDLTFFSFSAEVRDGRLWCYRVGTPFTSATQTLNVKVSKSFRRSSGRLHTRDTLYGPILSSPGPATLGSQVDPGSPSHSRRSPPVLCVFPHTSSRSPPVLRLFPHTSSRSHAPEMGLCYPSVSSTTSSSPHSPSPRVNVSNKDIQAPILTPTPSSDLPPRLGSFVPP